jgi:hypothetical protein
MNNIFWSYEDDNWGGINDNLIIIPNRFIKAYLYGYYNYLSNENNIKKLLSEKIGLNVERLCSTIFKFNNWKIGVMKSNAYISADCIDEKTTWGKIKYSDKYDTFYKYDTQLEKSQENLIIYNKGNKWKFNGINKLLLIDEPKKIPLKINNRILTNNYRIILSNNNRVMPQNNNRVIPQYNNRVIPQYNNRVIPQNNRVIPQNNRVIPQNNNRGRMLKNNRAILQNYKRVIPQNNNRAIPQNNNRMILSNRNNINWLLFKKSKHRR